MPEAFSHEDINFGTEFWFSLVSIGLVQKSFNEFQNYMLHIYLLIQNSCERYKFKMHLLLQNFKSLAQCFRVEQLNYDKQHF